MIMMMMMMEVVMMMVMMRRMRRRRRRKRRRRRRMMMVMMTDLLEEVLLVVVEDVQSLVLLELQKVAQRLHELLLVRTPRQRPLLSTNPPSSDTMARTLLVVAGRKERDSTHNLGICMYIYIEVAQRLHELLLVGSARQRPLLFTPTRHPPHLQTLKHYCFTDRSTRTQLSAAPCRHPHDLQTAKSPSFLKNKLRHIPHTHTRDTKLYP
jgi:hypothetical protein